MFGGQTFERDRSPPEHLASLYGGHPRRELRGAGREHASRRFGFDDHPTAGERRRCDRLDCIRRAAQQTEQAPGAGRPLRRHDDDLSGEPGFLHGVLSRRERAQHRLGC
jgi:hypothetical protein